MRCVLQVRRRAARTPLPNNFAPPLHQAIEIRPHALFPVPLAAGRGFGILRRAGFKEIRMFDAIQNFRQPGQWVFSTP